MDTRMVKKDPFNDWAIFFWKMVHSILQDDFPKPIFCGYLANVPTHSWKDGYYFLYTPEMRARAHSVCGNLASRNLGESAHSSSLGDRWGEMFSEISVHWHVYPLNLWSHHCEPSIIKLIFSMGPHQEPWTVCSWWESRKEPNVVFALEEHIT